MKEKASEILGQIADNVERVIIGKREVIELILCAFVCRGHVLIEDVPGVGKTNLVSALAKSFDCTFRRIQFTPDIMPSDITGFSMYNQKTGEFEYREGAVMTQILLADEINRTSPKTQSSLLEAMEENQVTVDGRTYRVPEPFLVLATQNPVEYLGTYPLPEAQLDRFFMRVSLGYPSAADETNMLSIHNDKNPLDALTSVATARMLVEMQEYLGTIHVDERLKAYMVDLVRHTRENGDVLLGGSPRATLNLYRAAQAWALYQGRDYVEPDDVQRMAVPVMEHRILVKQDARLRQVTPRTVIEAAVSAIAVP
ncbi:MoxR family ATPase [Ruminococcaceae bacterium OttesenSCG-928-L11]|nr:MoxR family ATPase [Ruminococcaceae bacterium OttesenSCG-928-L11]